jgi:DNA-binding IclR family transcriptional regulator
MSKQSLSEDESSTPAAEGGVAAVDRAFAILAAFDVGSNSLPLAEIARRTGLYKSTILRLMSSLERAGFIRRLGDGQYAVGPEPLRLAQVYQTSFRLRDVIYPLLESLSLASGETSSFYVRENDTRVVLFRVEPKRAVRVALHEGARFSLNVGASGKVLRAFAGTSDPMLGIVREQFWATSFGERDAETAAVSVPVFNAAYDLTGAMTLSGPAERFSQEKVATACGLLLEAAAKATLALGGDNRELLKALERAALQG